MEKEGRKKEAVIAYFKTLPWIFSVWNEVNPQKPVRIADLRGRARNLDSPEHEADY